MDKHDEELIKKAKSTIWENAMAYLDQVHSEEAYVIIDDYCRSQFHKYED